MISDTLFDAIAQIEQYQREYPGTYKLCEQEISIVVALMDALRERFDVSPEPSPAGQVEWFNRVGELILQAKPIADEFRRVQSVYRAWNRDPGGSHGQPS